MESDGRFHGLNSWLNRLWLNPRLNELTRETDPWFARKKEARSKPGCRIFCLGPIASSLADRLFLHPAAVELAVVFRVEGLDQEA